MQTQLLDQREAAKLLRLPLRHWSEIAIPEGVSELERLTYVPGLVGDITEWIVRGAKRPNRMMALGAAIVTVGTLCSQRVVGPTDSGTHLYIIIIAPTGYEGSPLSAYVIQNLALVQFANIPDSSSTSSPNCMVSPLALTTALSYSRA